MKRWIALLLALMSIMALCACGESAPPEPTEAEKVEAQIGALGVIGLNSKDAIEAAEAAWAALSPAEQAEVHNYAVLQAARLVYDDAAAKQAAADAEAAYAAAIAPFVGTWVVECPVLDPEPFELRDDGTYHKDAYTGAWSADPDAGTLDIDGTRWIVFQEDGFTKIRKDIQWGSYAFVLEPDLAEAQALKYCSFELNSDNFRDYVGEFTKIGNETDVWGAADHNSDIYFVPSELYDQGYVSIGSRDVSIDITLRTGSFPLNGLGFWTGTSPRYGSQAKGALWYIKDSYIAQNRLTMIDAPGFSDYYYYRVLTLSSGEVIVDRPIYISYCSLDGPYEDLAAFYEDHKY